MATLAAGLTYQEMLMYGSGVATRLNDRQLAARRFQALGDEIRLDILRLLQDGERCVCELTAALGMAQSRLSFHLKVLKEGGIISQRRQGRWSYYAVDPEALRQIESFLRATAPPQSVCCRR